MSSSSRTKEQRAASQEKFYTPPALALACVSRLKADGLLSFPVVGGTSYRAIDPCAGAGAWIRAMQAIGISDRCIVANDLDAEAMQKIDYLPSSNVWVLDALTLDGGWDLVVGNPPFNTADEHILAGLEMRRPDTGILGLILRDGFFAVKKRMGFWLEHRPTKVYLLAPRPPFRSGRGNTDSATYVFVVWSCAWEAARRTLPHPFETTLDIIDWSDYRTTVASEVEGVPHAKTKRRRKAA